MYRNVHKYFIDLFNSHMIQYSSGYGSRFPRKRPWFESQLSNTILYFVVVFSVCFFFFFFFLTFFPFLSLTASTIRQFLHLGIKSQEAEDILYCVQNFSLFLCSHSICLHIRAIFDHTNEGFMQQNMFIGCGRIYYISHNLLL